MFVSSEKNKMSDSESDFDITNPSVFTFQNTNTTVCARGPNTNISNFSFRNPMTSTMYLPRNFERQRYAASVSDQRSIYYRRETSPMSIHSACDIQPRNFQPYYNGMASNRSVSNKRSHSPGSVRSMDSSATVSAADIAFAFKNVKYNKYDLKVIKEAYNKLIKQRFRKRIEKKRNMKLFLKGNRYKSGGESGEQGSDSSISSDDGRSVKTFYKENMSSSRSTRTDLLNFRKPHRDIDKNCTDQIRPNNFKFPVGSTNINRSHQFNSTLMSKSSQPTLKDRFRNGFILPSQRFNNSIAASVIPEKVYDPQKNTANRHRQMQDRHCESGTSDEEIFPNNITVKEKTFNTDPRKRSLNSDNESDLPNKKKSKISSPAKKYQSNETALKTKNTNHVNNNNEDSNNFEFARPALPVRKSKQKFQETVIAKSKQPLTGFVEPISKQIPSNTESVPIVSQEKSNTETQPDQAELTVNSDVSMRPSFIKRKLFTQKLDVAEKANLSSDGMNSPQNNVYSAILKEKNKARKLVTSQSCLNRDIQDDSNLLDLIHKIVPADQINTTNQTTINHNKTDANNSDKRDSDKWDVMSVISMCDDNVSDTFTDEDILITEDPKKIDQAMKKPDAPNPKLKKETNSTSNEKAKNTRKEIASTSNAKAKNTKANDSSITVKIKNARIAIDSTNKEKIRNGRKENDSATKNAKDKYNLARNCKVVLENVIDSDNGFTLPVNNQNVKIINKNLNIGTQKSSARTFWDTDYESEAECKVTTQKIYGKENKAKDVQKEEFKIPIAPRSPLSKRNNPAPETSRWLNKTSNTSVMNSTLDSTQKFNLSSISLRSHRTTKTRKCCAENNNHTDHNKSIAKVIVNKKTFVPLNHDKKMSQSTKSETSKRPASKALQLSPGATENKKTENIPAKTKSVTDLKTPKKRGRPKSKMNNSNNSKTLSPRETKSKTTKQKSTKLNPNYLTPVRPLRTCRTSNQNRSAENSRSSLQFDISPLNIIPRGSKRMDKNHHKRKR